MKFRVFLLYFCLIISTVCLGTGYFLAGYWQIVPILLGSLLLRTMLKKQSADWSASGFLLVYVVLTAFGVMADVSTEFMIVTCTFALASWDLLRFDRSIIGNSLSHTGKSIEKHHLRSLSMAVVTGLALAFVSLYIHLQLSFGVIVSLVLIALGGLTYSMQHSRNVRQ